MAFQTWETLINAGQQASPGVGKILVNTATATDVSPGAGVSGFGCLSASGVAVSPLSPDVAGKGSLGGDALLSSFPVGAPASGCGGAMAKRDVAWSATIIAS